MAIHQSLTSKLVGCHKEVWSINPVNQVAYQTRCWPTAIAMFELRNDERKGRSLFASRNIKAGEIVLDEVSCCGDVELVPSFFHIVRF